ncbi:MAG: tRNA 2-thiocytidine biosynthesis protein TtcA [Spirochaetales bacterium]|nr:tRNA 2-thiocytidine biosynthesis protein TtcA [Spirochaetales bacterium]
MADVERLVSKRIGQAIFNYKLIEPGDRILAAVSGGKDSVTMLYDLLKRRKSFPIKYDIEAVHIETDFCQSCKKSNLENLFKEWGVAYHIVPVPVIKRLKQGKTMNCYWCSTQRRMELLKLCQTHGYNKIALGHHMDDIIETFFMNIFYKGEMATMLPRFTYTKFPYTVIRPLSLVSENLITRFALKKNIDRIVCKCPYGANSKRKKVKEMIRQMTGNQDSVRYTIFTALNNIRPEYLIGSPADLKKSESIFRTLEGV